MTVATLLIRLTRMCSRNAKFVLALGAALACLCCAAAYLRLGVSTNVDTLFAASLPWKQFEAERKKLFPQFEDLLVVVIDARIPEEADATAQALYVALLADKDHFLEVRRPDASPFFDQNGLLFLDQNTLEGLLNQTIDAQPFLGQLAADPSARGLFSALSLIGVGVEQGQADLTSFEPSLRAFHASFSSALQGAPMPLSWQQLLSGPVSDLGGKYRFVLAKPRLDFNQLQPGGRDTAALRAAIARLEFVASGAARVRITGSVALSDEEFSTVAQGAAWGLAASIALVIALLFLAVRSWRLVVPILLTLGLGLLATTGFAAIAVGTLNLISVAFAVLFVGIAVDFSIQFSVRDREMRHESPNMQVALERTAGRAGVQILAAALATSAGFLAFVPTDFVGVAELGLIAGMGMIIAFACSLTFMPAALTVFKPRTEPGEIGFEWGVAGDRWLVRYRRPVLAAFAALFVIGLASLPRLSFDSDPLHTKNTHTEAMTTLSDLMESPLTTPYTIDVLAPTAAAAKLDASRIASLPLVAQVVNINSFVPEDQGPKLALIEDAAAVLGPTLAPQAAPPPVTPGDLRRAAGAAHRSLTPALAKLPQGHPLAAIDGDLGRLETADDRTLMAANDALTRFLPAQLDRLRAALTAAPVTLDSIPPDIAGDWLLPDGRARVQAVAKPGAQDSVGLRRFVVQVESAAPNAGGSAVEIAATADTIVDAFKRAAIGALIAISLLLLLTLRRILHVAMVLAPLLLSTMLTVVVAAWWPIPLNFANIIALPLLLGVGVSFNIYFVMNWRLGETSRLGSATARAIVYSALTTSTAFGSLALSGHPGTASMGRLLLLSLACTLVSSLVFIPALLASVPARRPARTAA